MTDSTDQIKLVRDALTTIKDPETGRALSKQIHDVKADHSSISAQIGLNIVLLATARRFSDGNCQLPASEVSRCQRRLGGDRSP